MDRRSFLKASMIAAMFPAMAYSAPAASGTALREGVTPGPEKFTRIPITASPAGEWPIWQYGDYVRYSRALTEQDIASAKAILRAQAKKLAMLLQVPDFSSKMVFIIQQPGGPEAMWPRTATLGWKVEIPAPQWQWVLSECPDKPELLHRVLRTRRPLIPITLNARTQMIPRGLVRDYLRGVM